MASVQPRGKATLSQFSTTTASTGGESIREIKPARVRIAIPNLKNQLRILLVQKIRRHVRRCFNNRRVIIQAGKWIFDGRRVHCLAAGKLVAFQCEHDWLYGDRLSDPETFERSMCHGNNGLMIVTRLLCEIVLGICGSIGLLIFTKWICKFSVMFALSCLFDTIVKSLFVRKTECVKKYVEYIEYKDCSFNWVDSKWRSMCQHYYYNITMYNERYFLSLYDY